MVLQETTGLKPEFLFPFPLVFQLCAMIVCVLPYYATK